MTDNVLEVNRCWIQAYPSHNLGSFRSLDKPKFIFVDEGDFFPVGQLEEIRHVSERYIAKSNPCIAMVSTPNNPGGLFEQIENEPVDSCLYHRLHLDYRVGLGKIYSIHDIEKAKQSPSFEREYDLKYLGRVGNVFSPSQIQTCIDLGTEYSIDKIPVSLYALKSVGIDPGFSSSGTGIVVLEHIKPELKEDKIRVLKSHLIEKGDPNQIVTLCWDIWKRHNYMNTLFFIDGSNRAMVNLLKIRWDESLNWESKSSFGDNIKIRPVNFSTEHKNMLSNLHAMISKGYLAIEEKHDKLLTSLRTAYAEELNLKKEQTSYSDLLDALRLSLKGYQVK